MNSARPVATSLVIAVPTYRRPATLRRAVQETSCQLAALAEDKDSSFSDVSVLVIDNDPAGSAQGTAADLGARYVVEDHPGVAAVRNRALDESGSTDLLVFLDDDEEPGSQWLTELVSAWQRFDADAVSGPVLPDYEAEPDAWVRGGGFFTHFSWPTGTLRPVAATNNLLLDLRYVREHGLRFNEAFGATGGEDSLFTRELTDGGGRLVWSNEAVVHDLVPTARLEHSWLLRRQRTHAATAVRVDLHRAGSGRHLGVRALAFAGGTARVGVGAMKVAAGAVTGDTARRADGARILARGRGMAAGAVGRGLHSEYGHRD